MGNAIVCLTRGYPHSIGYDQLIKRNDAIYKIFGNKYDVVIFHEGNINERHQRYIKASTPLNFIFKDISKIWSGGYEGMCRFQSVQLFEQCKEYDYIMRIDEDCVLERLDVDPFENMGDNVYAYSVYWGESHSETNATLPGAISKLTKVPVEEFYNNKFPYTNVGVAKVSFFTTDPMYSILYILANSQSQRTNRWGDLPLHGSLLQIYAKDKVMQIKGLIYHHGTHNVTISNV
jgi:hypothetical protein